MLNSRAVNATEFKEREEVGLAEGPPQGTAGVFIRLRPDVNWAEIRERNGEVRSPPVVWLQHADPVRDTVS